MNDHDGAPSGERDLVRSGLPQLVPGWGVRTHVLPRMLPGLAIFAGAVPPWFLVPDDAAAWVVLPLAGAVSGALTWFACRGLREHRRTLPRWAVLALPAAFLAWPALAVLAHFTAREKDYRDLALFEDAPPEVAAVLVAVPLVALAAGWLVICFTGVQLGVIALCRVAARQSWHDLRNTGRLHGRALPTMLFVSFLAFFSGEMWQLGEHLSWARTVPVLALFAVVTIAASATHLRDALAELDEVTLNARQNWNVLTVLATRQLVQTTIAGFGVFVFFALLGVIAVDPATARTWVGSDPAPSVIPGVPRALLRCATVLAAFGATNFAVSTMNDPVARGEFFRPIVADLEAVLTRHARAAPRPPGAS